MTLEFVSELPKQTRGARPNGAKAPYTASAITAFIESGQPQTCVEIEGKLPKSMYQTFQAYLRHNPGLRAQVAVHLNGGKLYLQRLDL